jgi:acyl dehydratase
MITMAASPIHVDSNYASTEMSGGHNLVVGSFIYSLLLGMSVPDISGRAIANLGVEKLRHTAPMYHGDTLYGETTIVHARSSKSRPATGIMTVETTGYNQDKKVVCTFMRSVLLPKRAEG